MIKPEISIIIPVWQEEEGYCTYLNHLLKNTRGENVEILVVDGHERGTTIQTISHPEIIKLTAPRGRALQMNTGARRARGKILLFLHSDTILPAQGLSEIRRILAQPKYVAGAFDLSIDSPRLSLKIISFFASLRSRISRIPYGDQGIFIRRDYFWSLGGYPPLPLMEDTALMKKIRRRGDLIFISPLAVQTSPRRWEREGLLHCTLRNWMIALLFSLGVSSEKLVDFYDFSKH